jgi:hypothetical protein
MKLFDSCRYEHVAFLWCYYFRTHFVCVYIEHLHVQCALSTLFVYVYD